MADSIFRGFSFPFSAGSTSFPREATDDELIRGSLIAIVSTARGERVMRPDFGTNAFGWVFEDNDQVLAEMARTDVMAAISRYEPRVIVQGISVSHDENHLIIDIDYVVVATRQPGSVSIESPL